MTQALELRPAPWQTRATTLLPLAVCGAFAATLWFLGDGQPWEKPAAVAVLAFGAWAARSGRRALGALYVRADAVGVRLVSGTAREGRQAAWDDVARCRVEERSTFGPGERRTPFVVFADADGRDLLSLSTQLCTRADTARLLRIARAELARRGATFDVPARWWEER